MHGSGSADAEAAERALASAVRAVAVPGVPGGVMICGAVTPEECGQIRAAAEAMGFTKDEPVGRHGGGAPPRDIFSSVLYHIWRVCAPLLCSACEGSKEPARIQPFCCISAYPPTHPYPPTQPHPPPAAYATGGESGIDGCVWFADDSLLGPIYSRVLPHLPALPPGVAGRPAGINARWRLFRYTEGAVYRPHVDGAWPGSGVRGYPSPIPPWFRPGFSAGLFQPVLRSAVRRSCAIAFAVRLGAISRYLLVVSEGFPGRNCVSQMKDGRLVFDAFGDRWSKMTFLLCAPEIPRIRPPHLPAPYPPRHAPTNPLAPT